MLKAEHITVRYGAKTAVTDVSFHVRPGEWWVLVGPNGAGKSSLIGAASGALSCEGSLSLKGRPLSAYSPRERAAEIGVLSQHHPAVYDYTVDEVVSLGRYAHRSGYFRSLDPEGPARIREALALTGLEPMRDRSLLTLSGGETQRVYLAQVLAQHPSLLMLDEPANHLDLPFQKHFFELIQFWAAEPGRAVITVMHDLTLARRYGTHALLMQEGRAVAAGPVPEVLTRDRLKAVYGMDVVAWMQEALSAWS